MKKDYEDKFSGPTKAIIRIMKNIFLDMNLDNELRERHMFGHKSFLYNGNTFALVGEWGRSENKDEVSPDEKLPSTPTLILLVIDKDLEKKLMKIKGSKYFSPGGTRLKSWVSLSGAYLQDEEKLIEILTVQINSYKNLPFKNLKNNGTII